LGDVGERVVRHVNAEELLLPAEELLSRGLRPRRRRGDRGLHGEIEQRHLPGEAVLRLALAGREGGVQAGELGEARAERVAGAGLDERLEHALVVALQVDPAAEVLERTERAVGVAGGDDVLDRALADVLDRAEAEADRLRVGPVTFIPGVGAKLESLSSYIEYRLGSTVTGGEFSMLMTNMIFNTEGAKTKVMAMSEGDNRNALAAQMIALLDTTAPGATTHHNDRNVHDLISQGEQLLAEVHAAAS